MKIFCPIFVVFGLLATVPPAWAEGNSIRGVVTDVKGRAVAGAQIRAERTDGKAPAAVVTTDAKGQYVLNYLAVGTYKVVAIVNKSPKSAASVKTSSAGWVKVDFALKDAFATQRKDQSATERIQGQDIRRMQETQGFGVSTVPVNVGGPGR